ncbi:MAG: response regulator [Pseudomonadota bacterium]
MRKENKTGLQIMIIDNDKYVRGSLTTFFGQGAIKLLIFKTALEGLNALKYQNVSVVISDYFLPDMNGLSFLKQVGRQYPDITRIMMSTIVSDELKIDAAVEGIEALIEKPISVSSIERILNKKNKQCSTHKTPETKDER